MKSPLFYFNFRTFSGSRSFKFLVEITHVVSFRISKAGTMKGRQRRGGSTKKNCAPYAIFCLYFLRTLVKSDVSVYILLPYDTSCSWIDHFFWASIGNCNGSIWGIVLAQFVCDFFNNTNLLFISRNSTCFQKIPILWLDRSAVDRSDFRRPTRSRAQMAGSPNWSVAGRPVS
jgi:hypothetical protein